MNAAKVTSKSRQARPAAPKARGGASSVLRLSKATPALPSGADLTRWFVRAALPLRAAAAAC
jgi:hypothetical protein